MPAAVTYAELSALVQAEIDRGYQTTQDGRRRLLALIEELHREERPDPSGLLNRTWSVASLEVAGLGGVGTLAPSRLDFTPTPGLTVLSGPNGCGKTSLAKALEVTLHGERSVREEVTGELWSAALLTEGTTRGVAEVVLVSGPDRLTIRMELDASSPGNVAAVLTDTHGSHPVEIGTAWREALLASRVCFSYARLQTRLQSNKDLQSYLEELLVLGPVWEEVRTALDQRAQDAKAAEKRLQTALRDAKAAEAVARQRFQDDPRQPTVPSDIVWPRSWAEDVDAWLGDNGLDAGGTLGSVAVDDGYEEQIELLASALRSAEVKLAEAEAELDSPQTAAMLDHLAAVARTTELDPDHCPLCGAETDWRAHARSVVERVEDRSTVAKAVEDAVRDLARWMDRSLAPLLESNIDGGPVSEVRELRAAIPSGGCRPHSRAHRAIGPLLAAVSSASHQAWIAELRRSSDASAEWRRARAELAASLTTVWREHGAVARDVGAWNEATKTLDRVQVEMRQSRQDAITERLRSALDRMLPEAQIKIDRIEHQGGAKQKRGVDIALTIGGQRATLGMLSSGQRNALLLAPLLMLEDAGPFDFLLIDDPVHALDDLRVDHLARELTRLAESRQVVVLTHDPRLEEHLRARWPTMEVVAMERDAATQTVSWKRYRTPWEALLNEADQIRDTAKADEWLDIASIESIITGLCRNALDGAIRQATITCAVERGDDVTAALTALGEQHETRRRVAHVLALAGGPGRLPRTEYCAREHLSGWNRGAHGEPAAGIDLKQAMRAARRACRELTEYSW